MNQGIGIQGQIVLSNAGTLHTLLLITLMKQIAQRSNVVLCYNSSWDAAFRGRKTEALAGAAVEAPHTLWLVGNARQSLYCIPVFSLRAFGLLEGKRKKKLKKYH